MVCGVGVSHKHLLVAVAETATVGEVNDLLQRTNSDIVGGLPLAKTLLVRFRDADTLARALELEEEFNSSDSTAAAALNMMAEATRLPPGTSSSANYSGQWEWGVDTPAGGNNAFELSRAPQMWNTLDHATRRRKPARRSVWGSWMANLP